MDFKTFFAGFDLTEIGNQIKDIVTAVKEVNAQIELLPGEDHIYVLLDVQPKDIIAYRVATGASTSSATGKKYLEIKRTIGKYNLEHLRNLTKDIDTSKMESIIRRVNPLLYGANQLIPISKDEKKVQIQLDFVNDDIIAYQVVMKIFEEKLIVSRVLGKWNLMDMVKN